MVESSKELIIPEWSLQAIGLSGGHGLDHILELIGGDSLRQFADVLAPEEQIIQIDLYENGNRGFR